MLASLTLLTATYAVPLTNSEGRIHASGVLLNRWTVLTAAHAVDTVGTVTFMQCGDTVVSGQVSRRSRVHDLALVTLYTSCTKVPSTELESQEPDSGDKVTVEGFPAREFAATPGIIIGYRLFNVHDARIGNGLFWVGMSVQADVRPGSSGGPVLSKTGKLCGIVHGYSESAPGKPGVVVPLRAIAQFIAIPED